MADFCCSNCGDPLAEANRVIAEQNGKVDTLAAMINQLSEKVMPPYMAEIIKQLETVRSAYMAEYARREAAENMLLQVERTLATIATDLHMMHCPDCRKHG